MFAINPQSPLPASISSAMGAVSSKITAFPASPDQDRIKRPLNAFLLWAKETRRLIKVEFPKTPSSEISKMLGVECRCLRETKKKLFVEYTEETWAEDSHYRSTPEGEKMKPHRTDEDPLPGGSMTPVANPQPAATTGVALMTVPYAFVYGGQNGPGAPMHEQMCNSLHQAVKSLPTPTYAFSSFQYSPMMAPAQTYMNSPYVYSTTTPYNLQPTVAMGTVMSGVIPDSLPPPGAMTLHFHTVPGDLIGTYTSRGGGDQCSCNTGSRDVHDCQNVDDEGSGNMSQAPIQEEDLL